MSTQNRESPRTKIMDLHVAVFEFDGSGLAHLLRLKVFTVVKSITHKH